jgi:hypothetical protein
MWDMSMPVISMVLVSMAHFKSETAIGRSGIMDAMKKLLHGLVGGMAPGLSSFLNRTCTCELMNWCFAAASVGEATLGDFTFGGALIVPILDIQGENPRPC